ILTGVLAIFAVGFIYAGIHGKEEEPTRGLEASPTVAAGGNNAALTITAKNVKFDQTTASIPGGPVTIAFDNEDSGVLHNLHIFQGTDNSGDSVGMTDTATAPDKQNLNVNLSPGTYFYQCDVHPTQMTGMLQVSGP